MEPTMVQDPFEGLLTRRTDEPGRDPRYHLKVGNKMVVITVSNHGLVTRWNNDHHLRRLPLGGPAMYPWALAYGRAARSRQVCLVPVRA